MEAVHDNAPNRKWVAVFGIALALVWPLLIKPIPFAKLGVAGEILDFAIPGMVFLVIFFWATRVEGMSLPSLGIRRPTAGTVGWALVGVIATFAAMSAYYGMVSVLFGGAAAAPAAIGAITSWPFYRIVLLCLNAGIVEELAFRFYPITRLYQLTGSKWIASLIPLVLFVGFHIPSFGWAQVVPVILGALVLLGLYWLRRDYWCNALTHFLVDFIPLGLAGLVGYKL